MKTLLKIFVLGFMGCFAFLFSGIANFSYATDSSEFKGFGINSDKVKDTGVIGTSKGTDQQSSLIDVIKKIINWTLGMLSLIALILLLWGGFHMVTAAGDETKFKKGFVILKQAAIGLTFIALAWLMVSLIFYVIGKSAGQAGVLEGTGVNTVAGTDKKK